MGKAMIVRGIAIGDAEGFKALSQAIDIHRVKPPIDRTFGFENAKDAFRAQSPSGLNRLPNSSARSSSTSLDHYGVACVRRPRTSGLPHMLVDDMRISSPDDRSTATLPCDALVVAVTDGRRVGHGISRRAFAIKPCQVGSATAPSVAGRPRWPAISGTASRTVFRRMAAGKLIRRWATLAASGLAENGIRVIPRETAQSYLDPEGRLLNLPSRRKQSVVV